MPKHHLSNSILSSILRKNNLGELISSREIDTGLINPIYLLNDSLILRIDLEKHDNSKKFQRESVLYEILPKFQIPTPSLIVLDEGKKLIDAPYILMSYIPGENLRESFTKLSESQQKEISFQLGHLASQIHCVKPVDIGQEDLFKNILSWSRWTMKDFEEQWELVSASNYLTESEKDTIALLFKEYKMIDLSAHGRLTHGDFSMGNVQVKNGKIVGIFDFEFAFIADPLWDLQKLPISFQLGEGFDVREFLKGYGEDVFTEDERMRLTMYCYMQGVWEIWATITQHMPFTKKHIDEGVELIRNTIKLEI